MGLLFGIIVYPYGFIRFQTKWINECLPQQRAEAGLSLLKNADENVKNILWPRCSVGGVSSISADFYCVLIYYPSLPSSVLVGWFVGRFWGWSTSASGSRNLILCHWKMGPFSLRWWWSTLSGCFSSFELAVIISSGGSFQCSALEPFSKGLIWKSEVCFEIRMFINIK